MSKRRNSKSEKSAPSEGHDAKRRKDKDTRDKDLAAKDLAAEDSLRDPKATSKATPKATPNTSSTSRTSTRSSTLRASTLSNSKASSSTTKASSKANSKTSTKKASSSKSSSSKPSSSKPSKLGNSNSSGVPSGSKSSSSQDKKSHKLKKHKDSEGHYMTTLNEVAPPVEEDPSSSKGLLTPPDILLNEEEKNVDLGDVVELYDSEEEKKKVVPESDNDAELLSDGESSGEEMDVGFDSDDNMNVKDVTKPTKSAKVIRSKKKKASTKQTKVLESYFEDVELARLGKSSVRLAICTIDMWPKEEEPNLDLLRDELGKMGNEEQLQSLAKISSDPREVKIFKRFISYGTSAVRSDIGTIVRILVAQFYKLSVAKGDQAQAEADRVKWLIDQKRYHQEVDLKTRTIIGGPFSSPCIGKILRAYFSDSPSQQDVFLIKRMKKEKRVPLRLIVMITALMEHSIREWYGGVKVKIHLTRPNNDAMLQSSDKDRYHALWLAMRDTKKNAKTYAEDLQIDLFQEMSTYDVDDDQIPKYDFKALEAAAKAKRKARKSLKVSDYSDNDNDSGSVSGRGSRRSGSGRGSGSHRSGSGSGSGSESDKGSDIDRDTDKGRSTGNNDYIEMDKTDSENDVKGSGSKEHEDSFAGDEDDGSLEGKGKGVAGRGD
ncbi:hypothetical protein F5880DRAFT_1511528 [Lentinula raphanica]|nr:hypothetical protein F5880DRAFT_1511528 [Lentinula raphanica]